MSKLLKEAIADAKAVRETALANARLALEEAFAPRLQSMLTKKLKEEELELDGEESEDEVSDEVEEGSYHEDDEEVDVADEAPEEEPAAEEAPVEDEVGGDEDIADEIDDLAGDEEEAVEEDSFDLDTIIKELEQEIDEGSYSEEDEEEVELEEGSCSEDDEEEAIEESEESEEESVEEQSDSSEIGKKDNHVDVADCKDCEDPQGSSLTEEEEKEGDHAEEEAEELDEEIDIEIVEESEEVKEEEDSEEEAVEETIEEGSYSEEDEEDEEINLEEILKELEEETNIEEEEDSSEISELKSANEKLQKENDEYRKVYKFLRGKLNEVNLLNAKLLYTNKLFKAHSLNEDQKLKVVESFDLTKNVREAKLVYATLGESFRSQGTEKSEPAPKKEVKTEKNPLTEGIASKAIKSTKPSKKILSEGNDLADRFKKLAGIQS